jgi:pentatricopeptide repeat protein
MFDLLDAQVFVILLDFYAKKGDMQNMTSMYQRMISLDIQPNVHIYTAMISGFTK